MIAVCASHGVKLMEAFMYRYTHRTTRVREIIRSGVLGEIKFINASFRFLLANPASIKLQPALGGGAFYDVGCYPVNFIGWIADEMAGQPGSGVARPESVCAEWVQSGGVDLMSSALLKYPSGLIAAVHCGFTAHKRVSAEIVGTEGVLEVPETYFDDTTPLVLTRGESRSEIAIDRYCREIEDFAEAILQARPPHFSLAESLRNAEIVDRLIAAAIK
jgi:D-xylose 1-dehydrogenase (NADP+, D-xylono-1,5-lactone-forming)